MSEDPVVPNWLLSRESGRESGVEVDVGCKTVYPGTVVGVYVEPRGDVSQGKASFSLRPEETGADKLKEIIEDDLKKRGVAGEVNILEDGNVEVIFPLAREVTETDDPKNKGVIVLEMQTYLKEFDVETFRIPYNKGGPVTVEGPKEIGK